MRSVGSRNLVNEEALAHGGGGGGGVAYGKKNNRANVLWRNIEARSHNHCRGQATNITYYECVFVDLGIQHAKRMRRIILSVACPGVPFFFPHYGIKGTIFGK
jgi:hypothetical protein